MWEGVAFGEVFQSLLFGEGADGGEFAEGIVEFPELLVFEQDDGEEGYGGDEGE